MVETILGCTLRSHLMRYVADDLPELSADDSHECSNECGKEAPFTFAESNRCTYDQAVRPVDPEPVVNVSRHGSGGSW